MGKGLVSKGKAGNKSKKSAMDNTDEYSNEDFESMSKSMTISASLQKPSKAATA